MADLFISHSHEDVAAARDLRVLLEAAGYTCWLAPDDVTGPVPWAEQILNAIDASKVMIILLSHAANASNHVSKEVGLALERDKALLPVRVEDVMPTGSLQYLLQLVQWVDAFPGPIRDHLAQVRRSVASVVPATLAPGQPDAALPPLAPPMPLPPPPLVNPAAAPSPEPKATAFGQLMGAQTQRTILAGVGILAAAAIVVVLLASGGSRPSPSAPPSASASGVATPSASPSLSIGPSPTDSASPSSGATGGLATNAPSASQLPAFPNAAESTLLGHVPIAIRSTCIKANAPQLITAAATAIVDCYPGTADAPNFVRYASFPTLQAMDSVYNADVAFAGTNASKVKLCNVPPYSGANAPYQRGPSTVGQLLCYPDGAAAWLDWTYAPDLIWVGASRADGDAKALFTWWTTSAGPF